MKGKISRREFLHVSALSGAGLVLASCAKATEEMPEETPKVEAPTPTTAPAEPTPTPEPEAAMEAPILAEMVASGDLPAREERMPTDPRTIAAVDGVGVYGGRLSLVSFGAFGDWGHCMLPGSFGEYNNGDIFPDHLESFEVSDDAKTYTFYYRKGLKWSDGEPATTDDVRFWFEDHIGNEEISPANPSWGWTVKGNVAELEVIDDYTYKTSWPDPNPTFAYTLRYWAGMFFASPTGTPAHYMKQFHIAYNPDVESEATEAGFDTWVGYYGARQNPTGGDYAHLTPALCAWLVEEVAETHNQYKRNPYYWGVDEAGNQLPYFDDVLQQNVTDKETYTLKIVAGEADYAAFHTQISDMPLYQEGAEQGGYEVRRYSSPRGSDESFSFNFTDEDPVMREIFNDPRWNQAMSYAINRNEVNEVVFLGTATPRQAAPNPETSFYKEEWGTHCAEYNPDKANELLDEMGLDQRGSDGYRLRPDGEQLAILIEYTNNIDSPAEDVILLVQQHWDAVGVKVDIKELERELLFTRGQTNQLQCGVWHTDRTNESRIYVPTAGKLIADTIQGEMPGTNEYYRWYNTGGEEGIQPPEDWLEHFADIDAWHTATTEEEYKRLAQKIFDFVVVEKLRVIGTVAFQAWPMLVKHDIKNIPQTGFMGDDTGFARSLLTETWYREV